MSELGKTFDPEGLLDLTGLKCPLPALMARRALLRARTGEMLTVLADDPLAAVDLPHMCHQEGFEVVSVTRDGTLCRVAMRKPA